MVKAIICGISENVLLECATEVLVCFGVESAVKTVFFNLLMEDLLFLGFHSFSSMLH